MFWSSPRTNVLIAAFAVHLVLAPATVFAQEEMAGVRLYAVTPALEKALARPRYFSPEDPARKAEQSRRRWRKAWIGSVATFAVANVLDLHSSAGKMELNPLLRSADGRFSVPRAAVLKGGIGAGFVALQGWMIHRNPEKNYYKHFTFANTAAAGGLGALAVRNYGIPKPAAGR